MRISLIGLLGVASANERFSETVSTGRSFGFLLNHSLTVNNDEAVMTSGRNTWGQLGHGGDGGDLSKSMNLLAVLGEEYNETTAKAIAAGAFHSLLLLDNGDVFSAGRNNHGQLGIGASPAQTDKWQKVNLPSPAQAVAAGYAHSVFLLEDGTVMATGSNSAGQLGLGDKMKRTTPEQMLVVGNNGSSVAAGYDFSYILSKGGEVYSTGQNLGGQLGVGDKMPREEPTKVVYEVDGSGRRRTVPNKVKQIAAGNSHGLFVDETERLWGVGTAFNGQLGNNQCNHAKETHGQGKLFHTMPFHMERLTGWTGVKLVSAAGDSSCISTWKLMCFGSNLDGQLGLGEKGDANNCMADNVFVKPTTVSDDLDFIDSMSVSDSHSFFLNYGVNEDSLYVTGSNMYGALGNSSWNSTYRPEYLVDHTAQDRETRTTTPVPPTAAPTPSPIAPSPTTAPMPSTTRNINADNGGTPWAVIVMAGGVSVAIVILLVVLARGGNDEAQADGPSSEAPQEDLEMIRGQMSMN